MPIKWPGENNERLLCLYTKLAQLKGADFVNLWKEEYGKDGIQVPTARAIEDHIWKLKTGRTGTAAGGATSTPRKSTGTATPKNRTTKAPKTPKSATPRTPVSGSKRKRTTMSEDDMSDGEETEQELSKADITDKVGRRASLPRSKKSSSKTYAEDSSDEEGMKERRPLSKMLRAKHIKMEGGVENGNDVINDFFNIDAAAEQAGKETVTNHLAAPSTNKNFRIEDYSDAMSDISNFSATFS